MQTHIRCFSEINSFSISDDLTRVILGVDRVGICGGASANHPEIARFLAELSIDSISAKTGSLHPTMPVVCEPEQALGSAGAAA